MKRYIILLLLIISVPVCYSQEKIYFDKDWNETFKENASYYRTSIKQGNNNYFVTDYYLNHKPQMTGYFSDTNSKKPIRNGYFRYFGPNGKISSEGSFQNNTQIGKWGYHYENDNGTDTVFVQEYSKMVSFQYFDSAGITRTIQSADHILNTNDFYHALFWDKTDFSCDNFNDLSMFKYAKFITISNFDSCKFNNASFFDSAKFYSSADFTASYFYKKTEFSGCEFDKDIMFKHAKFYDDVSFNNAQMNHIDFDSAYFACELNFSHIINHKNVNFSNATLKANADFSYSDSASFKFVKTTLPNFIDFSYDSKMPEEIDLSQCNFKDTSRYDSVKDAYKEGRWHYINLYKSDISKFHIDYYHFRLWFPKELPIDEEKSIYELVLKNFKDRGQDDSYAMLDIDYHDFIWSSRPKILSWLYIFPKYWNMYGHWKGLVFAWTLGFLLLFTIITFRHLPYLQKEVYPVDVITRFLKAERKGHKPDEHGSDDQVYGQFYKRLWSSFIYTSYIFLPLAIKFDKLKVENKLGTFYVLAVYTLGLLCVAYIADFVLQK